MQLGAVYWVQITHPDDAEPRIPHPHVVVELVTPPDDAALEALIVCALTTNANKFHLPGNVLLDVGEANLQRRSVVEVAKTALITPAQLGDTIGVLSAERVAQIHAGMRFVQRSFFDR